MRKKLCKILITGGAGFIGSEFTRLVVKNGFMPVVVDKLTYAGDLERLKTVKGKYKFYKVDICNKKQMQLIFEKEKPQFVAHLAAESHVDRSILDSCCFIETNVKGTQNLLDLARKFDIKRLIHTSTDEVYGDIENGKFCEDSHINPSSPYSASKAAADCLIKSYIRTYNTPCIIVRPSNNYGPWQYPEKFIPVAIYNAFKNNKIPVYGKGLNIREWLHVSDCAEAIIFVLKNGKLGEVYNIGSNIEIKNIELVGKILNILSKPKSLFKFVKDRPGHDYRYSLDSSKIIQLGWKPRVKIEDGIKETINWYLQNINWLEKKVKYLKCYWKKVYK